MTPIDFPECNLMLAEEQPQYQTLPVFVDSRVVETNDGPKEIPWSMTLCYELSDDDIAELIATRKLHYRQMLYGHQFQPIFLSTKDPFQPHNKKHWPAD
jgi:hypothetical protein